MWQKDVRMPINFDFIRRASGKFRTRAETLESCGLNLCDARYMKPINENYPNVAYQVVYGARYLYAYYVEYYEMASLLADHLAGKARELDIVSIGCGLCPDYYALLHAFNGTLSFNYRGYDAVAWKARDLLIPVSPPNFFCWDTGVEHLSACDIMSVDVYVFPKSLTDIPPHVISYLASVIATTDKRELFFLNSYVRDENHPSGDIGPFSPIRQSLLENGFREQFGDQISNPPIELIHRKYRQNRSGVQLVACPKQNPLHCANCNVVKEPILNSYFSYQLLLYVKS